MASCSRRVHWPAGCDQTEPCLPIEEGLGSSLHSVHLKEDQHHHILSSSCGLSMIFPPACSCLKYSLSTWLRHRITYFILMLFDILISFWLQDFGGSFDKVSMAECVVWLWPVWERVGWLWWVWRGAILVGLGTCCGILLGDHGEWESVVDCNDSLRGQAPVSGLSSLYPWCHAVSLVCMCVPSARIGGSI